MRLSGRWVGAGAALIALAGIAYGQGKEPPRPPDKPQFLSVSEPPAEAPLYSVVELQLELKAAFENPFDPTQVTLDAEVTPPSGNAYHVPGFYFQDYAGEGETEKPVGQPGWRVRLALTEKGPNKVVLSVKDAAGTTQWKELSINGVEPKGHGFVRVSPRDPRYFEFQDGTPFFPIGTSFFSQTLTAFQPWPAKLAASGGNLARVFLAPYGSAFALTNKAAGANRIDLASAWRLDRALDAMAESGLHAVICADTYNELRERELNPQWTFNPLNRDNGGPLDTPRQFWTSDEAGKLYLQRMRYLFARYGADPTVMAWELWRDADLASGFEEDPVRAWFERNLEVLKAMDPYGHLMTTSFSDPLGVRSIDRLSGLDFLQTHLYTASDLVPPAVLQQAKKAGYGKPHLITEVAADRMGDRSKADPSGLQVHDPMWASMVSGAAGAAMPWWWETYLLPKRTLNRLPALANFVKGIDWPTQKFRSTTPTFEFQDPSGPRFYRDLVVDRGPVSWGNTEYNLPRHVRIFPGGVRYGLPVSGILHGGKLHPSKFNPVTFTMDTVKSTTFDLIITEVSGSGGATLNVKLDDQLVLGLDLADPDGLMDDRPITKYNGTYSVPIPPGHHTLVIADVGNDWVKASYRFRDLLPRKGPPLAGFSIVGDTMALAWVRQADRTWERVAVQKRPVVPSPPTLMTLRGLIPGAWRVELYDTWAGRVLKSQGLTVDAGGDAVVSLPAIETDLAVRMSRMTPARKAPRR